MSMQRVLCVVSFVSKTAVPGTILQHCRARRLKHPVWLAHVNHGDDCKLSI
jgi:hypothetical protein